MSPFRTHPWLRVVGRPPPATPGLESVGGQWAGGEAKVVAQPLTAEIAGLRAHGPVGPRQ